MFELMAWAAQWGIPLPALRDLEQRIGLHPTDAPAPLNGTSEAAVQAAARGAAPAYGGRLWRNNVGVLKDARGVPLRFGLCNDSARLNSIVKSSDLIGIYPRVVTEADVGRIIGQFDAVECKDVGWRYTATEHEKAQLAFGAMVLRLGGRFRFENGGGL